MIGGNILIKRPHLSRKWNMSKSGRIFVLCFCSPFGLENNCLSIILRNSEDQCSPQKCVCDILLIELVNPSPAWRVLCPALYEVCLYEIGGQSKEKGTFTKVLPQQGVVTSPVSFSAWCLASPRC